VTAAQRTELKRQVDEIRRMQLAMKPDERRFKAIGMREEGMTYKCISKRLNVPQTTVHNWVNGKKRK
jgi:transposase